MTSMQKMYYNAGDFYKLESFFQSLHVTDLNTHMYCTYKCKHFYDYSHDESITVCFSLPN